MKKKIFLIAAMCFMLLGLAACSQTDPASVDYNGYSYEDLKSNCQGTVQTLMYLGEEDKAYYLQSGGGDAIANLINRWDEAVAEYGSFVDFGDFVVTKSGKTLTAAQTLKMERRDVILTYVYTYHSMQVEDITVDAVYSIGEKMSKALMNTIMGIVVVFGVLIIICLLIFCFNIFPYLEKKKAGKTAAAAPAQDTAPAHIEVREERQTDDGELIAVIAAAIAAAEGTSTDGFVVRSIRRR